MFTIPRRNVIIEIYRLALLTSPGEGTFLSLLFPEFVFNYFRNDFFIMNTAIRYHYQDGLADLRKKLRGIISLSFFIRGAGDWKLGAGTCHLVLVAELNKNSTI